MDWQSEEKDSTEKVKLKICNVNLDQNRSFRRKKSKEGKLLKIIKKINVSWHGYEKTDT